MPKLKTRRDDLPGCNAEDQNLEQFRSRSEFRSTISSSAPGDLLRSRRHRKRDQGAGKNRRVELPPGPDEGHQTIFGPSHQGGIATPSQTRLLPALILRHQQSQEMKAPARRWTKIAASSSAEGVIAPATLAADSGRDAGLSPGNRADRHLRLRRRAFRAERQGPLWAEEQEAGSADRPALFQRGSTDRGPQRRQDLGAGLRQRPAVAFSGPAIGARTEGIASIRWAECASAQMDKLPARNLMGFRMSST